MFRVHKSVQQVGPSTTEDHKKNRMGASLTHLLRFNDNDEDFLEQIITGDETWVHQYFPETKAQSMAWKHPGTTTVKNFKTSNQLWETDGDCVLGYTWCASVSLFSS